MAARVETPAYVKYRREDGFGLVYEHENYGEEDASLYEVAEGVVDVLERADGGVDRDELAAAVGQETLEELLDLGVLQDAD